MALKLKLIKSYAGASARQLATIRGLGLRKMGETRLLKDTPEIRGMIFKVQHLVSHEVVAGEAPKRKRSKPRKIVQRDLARAKQPAEAR